MVDRFIHQTRLIVHNQRNTILPRNILRGNDYEFVPRNPRSESNFLDLAARNCAADGRAVEHARKRHVIDVLRLPRDFVAALFARNRNAYASVIGGAITHISIVNEKREE